MAPYADLRDLHAGLDELRHRELRGTANYPICCLLLWVGEHGLDLAVERYVMGEWDHLDALTGDDLLVFAVDHRRPRRQRWTPDVTDALRVKLDALPCALFFVPATEPRDQRCVLRLSRYIPKTDAQYDQEDVAKAFRAIAQAARDCSRKPSEQRLECLVLALEAAHRRTFPRDASGSDPSAELLPRLSAGSSVVGVLLTLAKLISGG
jgi:hypothetical protein